MLRKRTRNLFIALALGTLGWTAPTPVAAVQPDLFANYYVGPTRNGEGVPAQMYLSPRPVPPHVGHTFVTYQPFDPHEQLYKHKRTYFRYYPGGGFSTTHVHWW